MTPRQLLNELALDGHERLFVQLYWTEELSIEEAAAVLGVSRLAAEAMRRSIVRRTVAIVESGRAAEQ